MAAENVGQFEQFSVAAHDEIQPNWGAPPKDQDPDLTHMDLLDSRVNLGFPMAPSVESEYRSVIDKHEQMPQSEADRSIALEGRVRMLQHYMDAGDSIKVLQMAIETGQLYPEAFESGRFTRVAADSFLKLNPTFREMLSKASPAAQDMYAQYSMTDARESQWSYHATQVIMKGYDEKLRNPETRAEGLDDYRKFIANSEVQKPQDRGDRRMGGEARMRLIDCMQRSGEDSTETLQLMVDTMTKYPELSMSKRMIAAAQKLDAGNDAAWLKAYIAAGGDPDALEKTPKTP